MRLLSVVFYGSDHDARARRRGRARRHGSGGAGGIDPANLRDSRDDGPGDYYPREHDPDTDLRAKRREHAGGYRVFGTRGGRYRRPHR